MPSSKGKSAKGKSPAKAKVLAKEDFIQKGAKLPRDPNAPGPKVSAYMYFSQKEREKMAKKKGPPLDFTAAGTAIGKAWSELGDAGKKPFEALAAADAARYDKEMAKYKPSAKFTAELEAAKKNPKFAPRLKKDPAAPRKPSSAYLFYTGEAREALGKDKKHKNKSMTELSVVMGQQWSAMSDKDKAKFVKMADDDKARYENAMKKYKPTKQWLEAKEFLAEKKEKAKARTPAALEAKAAAKAKEQAKAVKEKNKKVEAAHKAAAAAYAKAAKAKAKLEADEAKAKAKVQALEAKLKSADGELKKLGVKPKAKKATKPKAPAKKASKAKAPAKKGKKAEAPADIVEAVPAKKRKAPAKKASAAKKKK